MFIPEAKPQDATGRHEKSNFLADTAVAGRYKRFGRQKGAAVLDDDFAWLHLLVNRLARGLPRWLDRGELLSDGYLALVRCRQTYDPSRGVPFRGFAVRRIRGAMIDGLRQRRGRERLVADVKPCVAPPAPRLDVRLDQLPRGRRLVIQLHYFERMDLKDVAATFRISQARVSQMHQRALRELRDAA